MSASKEAVGSLWLAEKNFEKIAANLRETARCCFFML